MSEDRFELADRLFDEALDLSPDERPAFLDARCGDDAELRSLLDRLLRAAETTGDLQPGGAMLGPMAEDLARELDAAAGGLVGSLLGHYRVTRELGRGGMAVVYLAEREAGDFEQRVAIKVLRSEIDSPESIRRFHQERQILARSSHPNIARLLDGGVTESHRPYLVMEHVEGEPIDAYCDRNRLTVGERLAVFLEAARAVEHAHRSLVVHRDIKPSNLMVTHDGHVKLLDFGIAKLLDPESAEATRTELRAMTPAYASPEQIRGEPITTATDVYQLGLLLYLLLTGCWPYEIDTRSEAALLLAVTRDAPTRPSAALTDSRVRVAEPADSPRSPEDLAAERRTSPEKLRRRLAGDLDTIVLKCLRKSPERRYGTVAQLIEDVEGHLEGRPISARPDTLTYRLGKFLGRHRLAATIAAVGFVAIAGLVAWDNARLARERDRARAEAAKATEVSDFLIGLFSGVAPTRSLGETVTARELVDRGADRVRKDLADQPDVQASMMTVIGRVYGELALFEEGEELLEAAIAIRRELPGEAAMDLASSLSALGELHESNKDLQAARKELEEALDLRREALGPDHPEVARTETRLGAVLGADGDLDASRELLERAVASLERHPGAEPADLGRALTWLAVTMRDQRDYEGSIPRFERAIGILEAALGEEHPDTVLPMFNLAYSLRYTDDVAGAERLYLESIERYERLYGTEHPRVGTAYNNYSLLLRDLERWDEAIERQERAMEIWRASLGADHIQLAWGYNNLGLIQAKRGDHEAARDLYLRSVEVTEAAVGRGHAELGVPLQNYALELVLTGRPAEAIPYFQRSLAIRERVYGRDHSYVGRTLSLLGRAYLEAGDYDLAEENLRRGIEIGIADGGHREHRVTEPTIALARTLAATGREEEALRLLAEEREATNEEGRELVEEALARWPG